MRTHASRDKHTAAVVLCGARARTRGPCVHSAYCRAVGSQRRRVAATWRYAGQSFVEAEAKRLMVRQQQPPSRPRPPESSPVPPYLRGACPRWAGALQHMGADCDVCYNGCNVY